MGERGEKEEGRVGRENSRRRAVHLAKAQQRALVPRRVKEQARQGERSKALRRWGKGITVGERRRRGEKRRRAGGVGRRKRAAHLA